MKIRQHKKKQANKSRQRMLPMRFLFAERGPASSPIVNDNTYFSP